MNRLEQAKRKLQDYSLELTPLKAEVLNYILESGPCSTSDAARMACGRLCLDYLSRMQSHRLFKDLEEKRVITCHRQYRNAIVEVPDTLKKPLTAHLESYRLLKHSILENQVAEATANYIAAKNLL